MFLLSRRQARTALAAGAGAAVYLAASEFGKDRLKLTGLFVLASASMAGMVTARTSAKAYNVENRFNNLLTNGGHFGGNVTVAGNHTVQGTLFGSGGTLTIGDNLGVPSGALQVNPQLTVLSGSGVHTNGGFFGSTTGDSDAGTAGSTYNTAYIQSLANRINDILHAIG